jgi:hypothetical protein
MSRVIRFMIAGDLEYSEERPETFVQVSESNCFDLLKWLWMEPSDFGYVAAPDLAARCRRRMWPIARNYDPALPPRGERSGNVRLVVAGREAGYLRARTEELLKLAERAGPEGQILCS